MEVLTACRMQVRVVPHVGHRTRMHEGIYGLYNNHERRRAVSL